MNTSILIISPKYLKENTVIDDNVDDNILESNIKKAQDRYVWTITGEKLYKKVLNDISGSTLSGSYKTLVDDYILPYLTEFALYETLPFINYHLTNKGIIQKNYDEGTSVDLEQTQYVRNNVKEMAFFYQKRLSDYIINNTDLFPEFNDISGGELVPELKQSSCGIFFPKKHCGCFEKGSRLAGINGQF